MDAKKAAAAVSAAGAILIAGCGGGRSGGGISMPSGGTTQGVAPPNSAKIAMKFTIPPRAQQGWTAPAHPFSKPAKLPKGVTMSAVTHPELPLATRKPKYISPAVMGGSIYVFVYQGNNLALTQGPFTVGSTYAYDFYCSGNPVTYAYTCANNANVFAPIGSDTFIAATYDSHNHLLSITPGAPGFYDVAQPSYNITSTGYPYPIAISTYGVVGVFGMDTATACVDPSFDGLYVQTAMIDGSGTYQPFGPLANPITINVTGGWNLYAFGSYFNGPVTTPYTLFDTSMYSIELVAQYTGASGSISISSANNTALINGRPGITQQNLYAVDRLGLASSTGGLNLIGLVDSGPAAYSCGLLPIANVFYATPMTFTNPVAIGGDDYLPGAFVIDNQSGSSYSDFVDLFRASFGFFPYTYTFEPYMPVRQHSLPGANPLEVTVSPVSVGHSMVYVLNADGSISSLNTANGVTGTVVGSGTISGPSGVAVMWHNTGGFDSVFATSSNTGNVTEIDGANTASPVPSPVPMASPGNGLVSPVTSSVYADNETIFQYLTFLAFDSGSGNADVLVTCTYAGGCANNVTATPFGNNVAQAAGQLGFAAPGGSLFSLAAKTNNILNFNAGLPATAAASTFPAFSSPVTRIVTSNDAQWNAAGAASIFQFFYNLGSAASGSIAGTRAVIVSPQGGGG